jgi:hypothetical protein
LIPASGDHAISLVHLRRHSSVDIEASIASRPTFVTIGRAPLAGAGRVETTMIFRKTEEEYFSRGGMMKFRLSEVFCSSEYLCPATLRSRVQDAPVVNTGNATRLVRQKRHGWSLESRPNRCLQPAKSNNRNFRDYPVTGHAADMPKSTRMRPISDLVLFSECATQVAGWETNWRSAAGDRTSSNYEILMILPARASRKHIRVVAALTAKTRTRRSTQ